MVDPSIRLQNIALEHAELVGRRAMSWSEATNRTAMFMSIVGAAVLAFALVGQATGPGALVVFHLGADGSVTVIAGIATAVLVAVGIGAWMYRQVVRVRTTFRPIVPAPGAMPHADPLAAEPAPDRPDVPPSAERPPAG